MAIAFWVNNNTTLISSTNLKVNYYKNEEADLYILCGISTYSLELLEIIENKKIFHNIFYANFPFFDRRTLPLHSIPKVRRFVNGKYIKKYWDNFFNHCVGKNKIYTNLFIPGFWVNGIYFVQHFANINSKIKYSYIEEGLPTFYFTRKTELTTYPSTDFKDKIVKIWEEFFLRFRHRKYFDGRLFTYAASNYYADNTVQPIPLPVIDDMNPICKELLSFVSEEDIIRLYRYRRAQVIFLAQNTVLYYDKDFSQTASILHVILDEFSKQQVVVKNHPGSNFMRAKFESILKKRLGNAYTRRYWLDNGSYLFESNLIHIDFSNKILITINSATLLYCKTIYAQEPYVIFLFRLYRTYIRYGDDTEIYAEDLKKMYTHPEKIFIPSTFVELTMILKLLAKNTEIPVVNDYVMKNVVLFGINDISLEYLKATMKTRQQAYIQALDVSSVDWSTVSSEKAKNVFFDMNPSENQLLECVIKTDDLLDGIDIVICVLRPPLIFEGVRNMLKKKQVRIFILEKLFLSNGKDYYRLQRLLEGTDSKAWGEYPFISQMATFLEELAQALSSCEAFSVDISGGGWGRREEAAGLLDMIHRLNGEKAEPFLDFSEVKMQVPEAEDDADVRFLGRISGRMGRCSFAMTSLVDEKSSLRIAVLSDNIAAILYPSENRATIAKAANSWQIETRKIREDDREKSAKDVMEALLTTGECGLTDYDTIVWEHVPLAEKFAKALAEEKMGKKKK